MDFQSSYDGFSVSVRPLVRERRVKLIEQVAVCAVNFHAVKTCPFRAFSRKGKMLHQIPNLRMRHGVCPLKRSVRGQDGTGKPAGTDAFLCHLRLLDC